MSKNKLNLYQIAYTKELLDNMEEGYLPLDNIKNDRQDWYEYWPIRSFFLNNEIRENEYYGFFSPRFKEKTGLSFNEVKHIITSLPDHTDVILFSPQPDMNAFFLNPFEQENTYDPGFIEACEVILECIGIKTNLSSIVMDSRNTVFSNYFIARKDFWRQWFILCEKLYFISEDTTHKGSILLNKETNYRGNAPRKVFLMERIASLMMHLDKEWKVHAINPFNFAWSMSKLRLYPEQAIISDALKIAYNTQGYSEYLTAFANIRNKFFIEPYSISTEN